MHTLQLELLAAIGGMLLLMYLTRGRKPKPSSKTKEQKAIRVFRSTRKRVKEPSL